VLAPAAATVDPMPVWLTDAEYRTLTVACARLVPADGGMGATEAGVADYIDTLLGAFTFDPPRIWAGGPTSGRFGGQAGFASFHELSLIEELAWRIRIEGTMGLPEREFNGAADGWQERYRRGLASLGDDFCDVDGEEQEARLQAEPSFTDMLYEHCCEGMYGAPEYGGNRHLSGWAALGFDGDVQPRGWTDAEVSAP
jgi:hypothetical protein